MGRDNASMWSSHVAAVTCAAADTDADQGGLPMFEHADEESEQQKPLHDDVEQSAEGSSPLGETGGTEQAGLLPLAAEASSMIVQNSAAAPASSVAGESSFSNAAKDVNDLEAVLHQRSDAGLALHNAASPVAESVAHSSEDTQLTAAEVAEDLALDASDSVLPRKEESEQHGKSSTGDTKVEEFEAHNDAHL